MPISVFLSPTSGILLRDEETAQLRAVGAAMRIDEIFCSTDPGRLVRDVFDGSPEFTGTLPDQWSPPVGGQEIWAAGVTYFRSRTARMEEAESTGGDVFYDRVYEAERPELFFKATAARARGHGDPVCIRPDSTWDVPEPELTLAISASGEIFGYTIGNDMSSRSIEGENPLYLPQAKMYRGSCALGPALVVGREAVSPETRISIQIRRAGEPVFQGETQVRQIKRGFEELAGFLFRANEFSLGAWLMTGTGIVPEAGFTLRPGDEIEISIDGIGTLRNRVSLAEL